MIVPLSNQWTRFAALPDGRYFLVRSGQAPRLALWDTVTNKMQETIPEEK